MAIQDKNIMMSMYTIEEMAQALKPVIGDVVRPIIEDIMIKLMGEEKLLSPKKVCEIFQPKISKTTLATWTKQGLITEYRIGGRVFYKQSEIIEKSKLIKKYNTHKVCN